MDHTAVGLRAAIRALSDVVAPALDPGHAQARDQLRLSIEYLEFVLQRLDLLHERTAFELRQHLAMAQDVHAAIEGLDLACGTELAAAIERVQRAPQHASPLQTLKAATADLAGAVSSVVREAPAFDEAVRQRIERRVLRASQARIAFERSWYLPQGLDPDPHEVRPLPEVLGAPPQR
ncbi:MAG: hypothetical protein KJ011_06280 [Burkholderiaceae bacterium]|nr:hypothetical protein [Burkholderiaceae bacterium]